MAETWVSLMLSNPPCASVEESTRVLRARFYHGLVNRQSAREPKLCSAPAVSSLVERTRSRSSAVHSRRVTLQSARDAEAQQCTRITIYLPHRGRLRTLPATGPIYVHTGLQNARDAEAQQCIRIPMYSKKK